VVNFVFPDFLHVKDDARQRVGVVVVSLLKIMSEKFVAVGLGRE